MITNLNNNQLAFLFTLNPTVNKDNTVKALNGITIAT